MEETKDVKEIKDTADVKNAALNNWKQVVQKMDRYSDFTLVADPIPFNEMFKDFDIERVQLHSTQIFETCGIKYIVGFCGVFNWKDQKLTSLDGDSYEENMLVLGYEWFKDDDGKECIDILVGTDW